MSPYISFLVISRNDNYGGAGTSRLQRSLDVLLWQLNDFQIDSEVIVVEWNPPSESPPLAESLQFSTGATCVSVRIITVPPRFHTVYRGHTEKGMHFSAAANVGLRRARGQFVMPKPSDIFYTDEVIQRIAAKDLDERTIYRVDRYDVDSGATQIPGVNREVFFHTCASAIVMHWTKIAMPDYFRICDLHTNACGDFLLISRNLWFEIRGMYEGCNVPDLDTDSLAMHAAAGLGASEEFWPDPCRVYKPTHANLTSARVKQVWRYPQQELEQIMGILLDNYDLNRLRMLLDFPRRTVAGISGTFPSFERNFLLRAQRWAEGRGPFYLNEKNWGLAEANLAERLLVRARWEEE